MKKLLFVASAFTTIGAFLSLTSLPSNAATLDVSVSSAWVKASTSSDHVGGMTGLFAKITNKSAKPIVLIGGATSFARVVEVHEVSNGIMAPKSGGIEIRPGKTVILQPGGLHVMLMQLSKKVLPGNRVDFKFIFRGAKPISLKVIAKASPSGSETYAPNLGSGQMNSNTSTPSPAK